jgi:hypothetical protein
MRILVFAFLLPFAFTTQAATDQSSSAACAKDLGDIPNIYLQARLSKAPLADREDRVELPKLPGREGNLQRFLEAQARPLSKEAKLLAERIGFFLRAGRLDFPTSQQEFSDQELTDFLIQTEEYIEESPSKIFDVPTPNSQERKIEEQNRSHEQLHQIYAGFAEHSADGGKVAEKAIASANRNHDAVIQKLRDSMPLKMDDLIRNTNKNDLSIIFASIREIFSQPHPIFGDVRTDASYPTNTPQLRRKASQMALQRTDADSEGDPLSLEDLRQGLNPPPAALTTKTEQADLAGFRDAYMRAITPLPVFAGLTYWGTDQSGDVVSRLVPGSIFEIKPFYNDVNVFVGTPSFNKAVAHLVEKTNWPHLVLYKINGRNGRISEKYYDTSRFPEVIFLPGTQFRVDSHEFFEGIHYVELTEVTNTIAAQPKEQELKVLLGRKVMNSEYPSTIRDLAGRNWRVRYDGDPGFQKSFSAYAWRTIFADLGISSVEAFRFPVTDKITVYIEEILDLPHLTKVPSRLSRQWLIPSLLAMTSVLLGDPDIYSNQISVYDRGGGRWVADGFWSRKSLLDSLRAAAVAPIDAIATTPFWQPFFKNHETAFFLWDQIKLLDPLGRQSEVLEDQLRAVGPRETILVEYLRALKARLDWAEEFIRTQYVYKRTQERGRGGMRPL